MALDLGTLSLSLVANDQLSAKLEKTKKAAKDLEKDFSKSGKNASLSLAKGLETGSSQVLRVTGGLGKAVGGVLKTTAAGAGIAIAGIFGTAIHQGFGRLKDIDNATGTLRGLGHEAEAVDAIMKSALNSVKGTSFGMGDAAKVAASTVAAGVKPGQDLQRTLTLVGDAATIAQTDMGSMGAIFNKVATSNKIQMSEMNQLMDRGIPIQQYLADHLGVSTDEVRKLASAGKIGFNDFQLAMEKGVGGAAQESGKTFEGAIKNVKSALGRLGAGFLGSAFEQMPAFFQRLGPLIDRMAPAFEGWGAALGRMAADALPAIERAIAWFIETGLPELISNISAVVGWISRNSSWLGPLVSGIAGATAGVMLMAKVITVVTAVTKAWGVAMLFASANPLVITIFAIVAAVGALIAIIAYLWKNNETFRNIVTGAWNGVKAAVDAVVTFFRDIVGPAFVAIFSGIANVVTTAWNGIVTAFLWVKSTLEAVWSVLWTWIKDTVSFAIFPIQLLIGGAFLVIRGLFLLFKAFIDTVWPPLWNGIKFVAEVVMTGLRIFIDTWRMILTTIFNTIRAGVMAVWTPMWNAISVAATFVMNNVRATIDFWKGVLLGVFNWIRDKVTPVWDFLWGSISSTATNLMNSVKTVIDIGLNAIKGFFSTAVETIGRIWDGLKDAASKPVRFVIETVINNGLIKGWNDLVDLLGMKDKRLAPVTMPAFMNGGILPGQAAGRGDNMMVVDRQGRGRATIRSGEGIIPEPVTRQYQRQGTWSSILRGQLPAFFNGGVMPTTPGRISRHPHPYHGTSWAGDMARPANTPVFAWHDGIVAQIQRLATSYGHNIIINHAQALGRTRYAHLLPGSIAVSVGQAVKQGMRIAGVGTTGNSSGNHLHFENIGGNIPISASGSADGGESAGSRFMGWITDKLSTPVKALIDKIPGAGVFLDVAKGAGSKLLGTVVEKIQSIIPGDWGLSGDTGSTARVNGTLIPRMFEIAKSWGLSRRIAHIMGITMMQEASGRQDWTPDSNSDVGIFQQRTPRDGSIDQLNNLEYAMRVFLYGRRATPGGYHVPGLYDKNWQAMGLGQAAQAVQVSAHPTYYDKHISSIAAALDSFGYAKGTLSASRGIHAIAENGPELVLNPQLRRFRGGETVLNASETARTVGGGRTTQFYYQPKVEAGRDPEKEFDDAMFKFRQEMNRRINA